MARLSQAEYKQCGGSRCPCCGSTDTRPVSRLVQDEDGQVVQHQACRECGSRWTDVFELKRYTIEVNTQSTRITNEDRRPYS